MKIVFLPEVIDYLNNLILVLAEKNYFSFEENAQLYVQNIYDFIEFEIQNFPHKTTPIKIKHLGQKYIFYKANQRTTWFIFFEQKDNRFLITQNNQ